LVCEPVKLRVDCIRFWAKVFSQTELAVKELVGMGKIAATTGVLGLLQLVWVLTLAK
jgi:hypothetical protein